MILKVSASERGLVAESGPLRLTVTGRLGLVPQLMTGDAPLGLVRDLGLSSFVARLGGFEVDAWNVEWNKIEQVELSGCSVSGKSLVIRGAATQHGEAFYAPLEIGIALTLDFYDTLPGVVTARAEFTNNGPQTLSVDSLISSRVFLDRRLDDPGKAPWNFASYQGGSTRWGHDYSVVWIDSRFERLNSTRADPNRPGDGEHGGAPLVDIWAPGSGLAVASAETHPVWSSLPVRTTRDGLVEVALSETPEARLGQKAVLKPGESVATGRSALIAHRLDFHDALRSWSNLLRVRGLPIVTESPADCHKPYWKSWGFGLDFTQEKIFGALEDIRQFGIGMAMLDDGWFTTYGDWEPNPSPGKFPAGDKDMRAYVAGVKERGFKTSLWWYPPGVESTSKLFQEHPDWLVMDEDGSYPTCYRKLHYLCPQHQPAVDYVVSLVEKFMGDWDYDGIYIDTTGLAASPPCFNPAHNHSSPLDSFFGQAKMYEAIYKTAQRIKPGAPVEMCICSLPHDPFKMPWYNVANSSDPTSLLQVRRRIKVEKAFRGPTFCVGDCYQIPLHEWEGWSVPESFESALGAGAQLTTLYSGLSETQREKWKTWFEMYNRLMLSSGEYLNHYDLAWDKPEAHVIRKDGRMYYAFFAERWPRNVPLELRGLERSKTYRVSDYVHGVDLGEISGGEPLVKCSFAGSLMLVAEAVV
jgi:alpha-galactosidase